MIQANAGIFAGLVIAIYIIGLVSKFIKAAKSQEQKNDPPDSPAVDIDSDTTTTISPDELEYFLGVPLSTEPKQERPTPRRQSTPRRSSAPRASGTQSPRPQRLDLSELPEEGIRATEDVTIFKAEDKQLSAEKKRLRRAVLLGEILQRKEF